MPEIPGVCLEVLCFQAKQAGERCTPGDWPGTPANYESPADGLEFIGEFYAKTRRA